MSLRAAALLLVAACTPDPSDKAPVDADPATVRLVGAVQKGPFVLGSSVDVSALDADLAPTGAVYATQTTNDRGEFVLDAAVAGPLQLEGTGFYYNEATGALSQGNLTLRAFAVVDEGGEAQVYVNLLTHLTAGRVRALVAGGAAFDDAVAQAEAEAVSALAISPPAYAPGRPAVTMNVLGGDDDDNAYLLAASAVLAQAGRDRTPASADAELQALINGIAADLAPDGALDAATAGAIAAAALALDVDAMVDAFHARLAAIGSDAVVPDVARVLDQDRDGFANAADLCDRVADDQSDGDGDLHGDACDACPTTPCEADCVPARGGADDTCVTRCEGDPTAPDACPAGTTCTTGVPWPGTWDAPAPALCTPPCDLATADCGPDAVCASWTAEGGDEAVAPVCVPRPVGVPTLDPGERCEGGLLQCGDGLVCADLLGTLACATTCDTTVAGACGDDPCVAQPWGGRHGACPDQAPEGAACFDVEDRVGGAPIADSCADGLACFFSDRCPEGPDSCCAPVCDGACDAGQACVGDLHEGGVQACVPLAGLGEPCRYATECGPDAGCFDGADTHSSYLPGDCRLHCGGDEDCTGDEVCLPAAIDGSKVCALAP